MKDHEIARRAGKMFPGVILPLLAAALLGRVMTNVIPSLPTLYFFLTTEGMDALRDEDLLDGLMLALTGVLALVGAMAASLLTLGAFRLCLDRGEGKAGRLPWTILGQWRAHKGWFLWAGLAPALWKGVKGFLRLWLGNRLTDMAYARMNVWISRFNVVLFVLSLAVLMPLTASVRAAYLRAPERGFWHGVAFGIAEGLRKWTGIIGVQLKFVVPVSLGINLISVLLSRAAFQMDLSGVYEARGLLSTVSALSGSGVPAAISGLGTVLGWLGNAWGLTVYGVLAAERFDPPPERM